MSEKAVGHWHRLEDNFHTSAQDFYSRVEALVATREVPDAEISRVVRKEGGIGTAEREYLRVARGRYFIDICCAPFGRGTFFSSWVVKPGPSFLIFLTIAVAALAFLFFGVLAGVSFVFRQEYGQYIVLMVVIPLILFGVGFFISLGAAIDTEERLIATPYIGALYVMIYNPDAFYRKDTETMFREAVSASVFDAVDELLVAINRPPLTLEERKPTMKDLPG